MTKTNKKIIGATIGCIVAFIILSGLVIGMFYPKHAIKECLILSAITIGLLIVIGLISLSLGKVADWVDKPYQIADDSPCKGCKTPNEECCSNY